MKYKAVLLFEDIPEKDWPPGVSGKTVYAVTDLSPSKRLPDNRPWRIWDEAQALQYDIETIDDNEAAQERANLLTLDQRIDLALRRAENYGAKLFREFKRRNVKAGLTKDQVRSMSKAMVDIERLLVGGSLKAFLEEIKLTTSQFIDDDTILEWGNKVRVEYFKIRPVESKNDLDLGVN